MNKIEKIVYDIVKSNPKIKIIIRNIYQSLFDLVPDKEDWFAGEIIEKKDYFFGFHDICPWSHNEKFLLANKLEISLAMPKARDPLTVGFWDSKMNIYTAVAQTHTWNYHKGCRLQWVGSSSENFIFNDVVDGHIGSNIFSVSGKKIMGINYPIDTVSPDGRYATSFSYERLNRYMPGYGYVHMDEPFFVEDASNKTGLFLLNLANGNRELIVSLRDLANLQPVKTMTGAHHYVTHTEFSPNGDRVSFLHRWTYDDPRKRFTRLVTCKLDGSDINVSNTSGMVSHYVWDKKHGILAYAQVDGIDGHYIFKDYKMDKAYRVGSQLNSDGHQSFLPGTDFFITDTYPDKIRRAKLFLVNIETDEVMLIADIKSPKKFQTPNVYKHWACDLHPRLSPSGRFVSFDSVHTGKRSFCIMKLNDRESGK